MAVLILLAVLIVRRLPVLELLLFLVLVKPSGVLNASVVARQSLGCWLAWLACFAFHFTLMTLICLVNSLQHVNAKSNRLTYAEELNIGKTFLPSFDQPVPRFPGFLR
jgi:hypothetical protein